MTSLPDSPVGCAVKARLPLNIIIVGCGLGGLSAAYTLGRIGHKVTVVETATATGEIGAGIQVCPNVARLLVRWGLGDKLKEASVVPQAITFRRYASGERMGWARMGHSMETYHGAPYYNVHRADLHRMLFDLAKPYMTLVLNRRVVKVDPLIPRVTLHTGEIMTADLIVGADGIRSTVREAVNGMKDAPSPTGDAAYRAIIPVEAMVADPDLRRLVDETEMTCWMGPERHITGYCIRNKKEYNIVMVFPDNSLEESYTAEGSTQQMRLHFAGWEPRIQKILDMISSTLVWPMIDRRPLKTWLHEAGKVVLLGDACHPMLPYKAQGAAMAIEDSAVLAGLLSHLTHRSQLLPMLQAYQRLRQPRTAQIQLESRLHGIQLHYPDGPDQIERDKAMREGLEAAFREAQGDLEGNANMWSDRTKNRAHFDYDADAIAEEWWKEYGPSLQQEEVTSKL
ncbi:FAD/NAD-binding domain-containing protein [Pluteus cervinus]|uniref:FAD/NAD-binding domain-containing protein n=1 Tax=Pluteus cervinus TaxID=181527 RepID=A0ACD3ANL5_9AGAR|nr:FAD/NAD-binding domain-containing protein [Pluteus cervinus]